ncbi:MAG: hypothetical protein CMJ75_19510 [Planctomycetaceae bacterium]|nr:hypothetical protein [Planctomycetaceae bacterium]
MKWWALTIGLSGVVGLVNALGISVSDVAKRSVLPGARAPIDASQYASLQEAIDALPVEGGVVRIPPGKFRVTEPLTIRHDDVLLVGSGTATHIENANTSGLPALRIYRPMSRENSQLRLWRVHVSNMRITGNPQSGPGIVASHVNEVYLEGVSVSHHGGDGILLDHCYEDPRVVDCLITYNGATGLNLLGCHDIVVAGNQFEENQDALHCFDGFNLCMTGNCLDDHLRHGVVIENTYGSVVSGNMIEECKQTAIILDRDCYGVTISANVIAHDGSGVDLRDAHGCAVSANTFTIIGVDALRIGPQSGRITVTGNTLCDSYIGEGKRRRGTDDLRAAGLVLEGTRSVAIAGNLFSSLRPKAVELRGADSRQVLFGDNLLVDSPSDHERLQQSVQGSVLITP